MPDTTQRVTIETEDGIRALKDLGNAGADAFSKIISAASSGDLSGLATKFGGEWAGAFTKATEQLNEFINAQDAAIMKTASMAKEMKTSPEAVQGLGAALGEAGVSSQGFERLVNRMSQRVSQDYTSMMKNIRTDHDSAEKSALNLQKAQEALQESYGVPKEAFAAQDKLMAQKEAQIRVDEAQEAVREQALKSIPNITEKLREGMKTGQQSADIAETDIGTLTKSLENLARTGKGPAGPMDVIHEMMKGIETGAIGADKALALVKSQMGSMRAGGGAGLDAENFILFAKDGGWEKFQATKEKISQTGLGITDEDIKHSSDAIAAGEKLTQVWGALKEKMGAAMAPQKANLENALADELTKIPAVAHAAAESLSPIKEGLKSIGDYIPKSLKDWIAKGVANEEANQAALDKKNAEWTKNQQAGNKQAAKAAQTRDRAKKDQEDRGSGGGGGGGGKDDPYDSNKHPENFQTDQYGVKRYTGPENLQPRRASDEDQGSGAPPPKQWPKTSGGTITHDIKSVTDPEDAPWRSADTAEKRAELQKQALAPTPEASGATAVATGPIESAINTVSGALHALESAVTSAAAKLMSLPSPRPNDGGSSGASPGPESNTLPTTGVATEAPFAAGGLVRSRVSNGEFVMGAGAVSRFGSDFMHAVNGGEVPKFADGGGVIQAIQERQAQYPLEDATEALENFEKEVATRKKPANSEQKVKDDQRRAQLKKAIDRAKLAADLRAFQKQKQQDDAAQREKDDKEKEADAGLKALGAPDMSKPGQFIPGSGASIHNVPGGDGTSTSDASSPGGGTQVAELPVMGVSGADDARMGSGPGGDAPPSPVSQDSAAGGEIHGAGSGTSDSIHAMLSHGEFVMKAAAVQNYGTNFMHAINNMGYAMGGPVVTRMADGGSAGGRGGGGGTPIHLHLAGQEFVTHAADNVASNLRTHAINQQTTSTGRKPSWMR